MTTSLIAQLGHLQRSLHTSATAILAPLALSPAALLALHHIAQQAHPSALAACLQMPRPTVSHLLRRLEAQGLVARAFDPADLRRSRLSLTGAGEELLADATRAIEVALARRLERLSPDEQDVLLHLLERLLAAEDGA
jgi:DNA-binding MarR family transcriptional regulator